MHTYSLKIIETHLDSFAHVNNATYLQIMEEARWDFITANGYGLNEVQKLKQGPVILEVNLKFFQELRNRENITITTELLDYKGKVGKIMQKIISSNGVCSAEGLFIFGLFDLKERKLIEPTDAWKKAIGFN